MARVVTLKTIPLNSFDMDGLLDHLIAVLNAARDEGLKQGLKNVRVDTDWKYAEYGPDKVWEINILGDKE